MKKIISVFVVMSLLYAHNVHAGFLVGHSTTQVGGSCQSSGWQVPPCSQRTSAINLPVRSSRTIWSRELRCQFQGDEERRPGRNLPKSVYILMAVLFLGWLAIGINDRFRGLNWIYSLLLYVFFGFPGMIYTLLCMRAYYM